MPDSPRNLTRASEILARYRGTADAWAARPRPLDPAPSTQRGRFPLVLENLAWHYLNSAALRQACDEREWTPQTWLSRLRDGQSPSWLQACPTEQNCVLGQRHMRRWSRVWENVFRQLRFLPPSAHLGSEATELGNLAGWFRRRQGGLPARGGILVSDQLPCLELRPRRLLHLGSSGPPVALAKLSSHSGLPARFILRLWPLRPGLYLPVCRCDRAHLLRPLLAISREDGEFALWDSLTPYFGRERAKTEPALVLSRARLNTAACPCGLTSWSLDERCYEKSE